MKREYEVYKIFHKCEVLDIFTKCSFVQKKKIGVQFKYVSLCFLNLFVKFIL